MIVAADESRSYCRDELIADGISRDAGRCALGQCRGAVARIRLRADDHHPVPRKGVDRIPAARREVASVDDEEVRPKPVDGARQHLAVAGLVGYPAAALPSEQLGGEASHHGMSDRHEHSWGAVAHRAGFGAHNVQYPLPGQV